MSKKDLKREVILKHAAKCLEDQGYYETNLEDIGLRVGLNKSSLLYYFNSKEQMLMQAVFHRVKPDVDEIQNQSLLKKTLSDSLEFYFKKRLELYLKIIEDVKLDVADFVYFEIEFKKMFSDFYTQEEVFIGHLVRNLGNLKKVYKGTEMELGQHICFVYRSIRTNYFVFKLEDKKLPRDKFKEMIEKLNFFLKMTITQIEM
jgi:AcrR family transcriptional regulator